MKNVVLLQGYKMPQEVAKHSGGLKCGGYTFHIHILIYIYIYQFPYGDNKCEYYYNIIIYNCYITVALFCRNGWLEKSI